MVKIVQMRTSFRDIHLCWKRSKTVDTDCKDNKNSIIINVKAIIFFIFSRFFIFLGKIKNSDVKH